MIGHGLHARNYGLFSEDISNSDCIISYVNKRETGNNVARMCRSSRLEGLRRTSGTRQRNTVHRLQRSVMLREDFMENEELN